MPAAAATPSPRVGIEDRLFDPFFGNALRIVNDATKSVVRVFTDSYAGAKGTLKKNRGETKAAWNNPNKNILQCTGNASYHLLKTLLATPISGIAHGIGSGVVNTVKTTVNPLVRFFSGWKGTGGGDFTLKGRKSPKSSAPTPPSAP